MDQKYFTVLYKIIINSIRETSNAVTIPINIKKICNLQAIYTKCLGQQKTLGFNIDFCNKDNGHDTYKKFKLA